MSRYRRGIMNVAINLIFVLSSMFSLASALSNEDIDYDPDYRNPQLQLEPDKQNRELLIREFLLNRYGRLLQQQHQQQLLPIQQPLFTYKFPPLRADETFAVPPSDPRYYYRNTYNDPEKFLRHMKDVRADVLDNLYKGAVSDVTDNVGPISDEESNFYDGEKTVSNNISNNDSDIDKELPLLQQQKAEISMPAVQVIRTRIGDFETTREDMIFIAVVAGCSAAAILIVAGIGFGWYRLHKKAKAAADVEYPAYGVTGPNKEVSPTGDRKLAESAQMYHYQHQKQQIISMSSSRASNEHRGSGSEAESDEENEEGDYTVYECPGLAATGEMEVKNPLFLDDPTPAAVNQPTICPSTPDAEQKPQK